MIKDSDPDHFTSISLSEDLYKAGCDLETDFFWYKNHAGWHLRKKDKDKTPEEMFGQHWKDNLYFRAYDILHDLCVRYATEFFGLCHFKETSIILHGLQREGHKATEMYIRSKLLDNFGKNDK